MPATKPIAQKNFIIITALAFIINTAFALGISNLTEPQVNNKNTEQQKTFQVQQKEDLSVDFLAVGDIMLARKVGRLMDTNGINYPFSLISEKINRFDIAFGNLESPIAEGGKPLPEKGICFRAKPAAATALKNAGFDIVSLANNHAVDYDGEALLETISLLEKNNIKWVGAGKNITQALQPVIMDKNGVKLGFLAFSDMADIFYSYSYRRIFRATDEQSGVAPMYEEIMTQEVEKLRKKVDIIVVSLHWGREYMHKPEQEQRLLAKKLIDCGADLIVGHHPHVLQGIERYKHGLIAYSLGNFVFDQRHEVTNQGLMLHVKFSPLGIENFEVLPLLIENCQVKLAEEEVKETILNKTMELSNLLDTTLVIKDSLSGLQYVMTGQKEIIEM
ncbi:MAG: hypothetical protein PWQ96_814 [Clostridia bacterium]|nr:Capsule synthesis protein CapA [Clostridiales bacterium]MDK2985172.1 hypothetical protein [Clostridia bacterium]